MHPQPFPNLHPGPCSSVGMRPETKQTHRRPRQLYISPRLRLTLMNHEKLQFCSRRELIVADRWSRAAVMACIEAAERCVPWDSNVRAETLQGTDRPSSLLAHAEIHPIRTFITASLSLQVSLRPMLWDRLSVCNVGILWPNGWMDQDMPLGTAVGLGLGDIVLYGDQLPLKKRGTAALSPLFGPCLLWPNGRPSQLLLSTCSLLA